MNLNSTLTWQEAEDDCKSKRGHLASIHSKAEGDFIVELAGNSTKSIWLGASDIVTEVKVVHFTMEYSQHYFKKIII